jgi:hypothetical protein
VALVRNRGSSVRRSSIAFPCLATSIRIAIPVTLNRSAANTKGLPAFGIQGASVVRTKEPVK